MPDNLLAGRYVIDELLGEGGIGVVYKAEDIQTNQVVAIKFLVQEQTVATPDQLVRQKYFAREIELLKKIRHPAIVSLLDSGFTAIGLPFFVMEYVQGRTLSEVMQEEKAMVLARVFRILQPLCSALDCIHQQGAIHRDLKPENIMIVDTKGKEEIKLLDFGIAKMVDHESGNFMKITQAGNIVGTVDYLAPEQWEDKTLDQRTDIYALGLVVYEMLTGQHPFRSPSFTDSMMMHLEKQAPPPSSLNPDLPLLMDEIILQSISKQKEDRQPTVVDFLTDFESILADIYRRSKSFLSNPATETLYFEASGEFENSLGDSEESEDDD